MGHRYKGADTKHYTQAVKKIDSFLGEVLRMIDNSPRFRGNTAVVLTSDHGFGGSNHADRKSKGNYRISLYVGMRVEAYRCYLGATNNCMCKYAGVCARGLTTYEHHVHVRTCSNIVRM